MTSTTNKYSIHKIAWHSGKLQSLRDGKVTAPIYVRVKPTNHCNHSCFFCVYRASFSGMHELSPDREENWEGPVNQLPAEKLWELLDDFKEIGVRAVTYSGGGEPLMHPAICKTMRHTLDLGIDLSIITNGQLLQGERAEVLGHAKWVRVSVDYHTPEQMAKFRSVPERNFQALLENLKSFSISKSQGCDLFINYIVHKDNFTGLLYAAKLYKDHGVDNVRFSPMWVPGFQDYHAPLKAEVERQLQAAQSLCNGSFTVNSTYDLESSTHSLHRGYSKCHFCQVVPVVAADGNVYACHNKAYDPKGLIGSIRDRKFSDLWFSEEARKSFNRIDPNKDCRHQCAADEKNILINDILAAHDNFV